MSGRLASAQELERFRAVAPLHTVQPPYNLFERAIEHAVLPYARRHHISTLTYGALYRGLLSSKMRPDTRFTGDDLRQTDPKFRPPRYAQYLRVVERLDRSAHEAVRQAGPQPGRALDAGPAWRQRGAMGCTPPRAVDARRQCRRMEAGCRRLARH